MIWKPGLYGSWTALIDSLIVLDDGDENDDQDEEGEHDAVLLSKQDV